MAYEKSKRARVEVLTRSDKGLVKKVRVQGTSETYIVIVRREFNCITAECLCESPLGYIPCLGNTYNICYHSIAALRFAAREMTRMLRLSEKGKPAIEKMARCGGTVVALRSRQSGKLIWGLA